MKFFFNKKTNSFLEKRMIYNEFNSNSITINSSFNDKKKLTDLLEYYINSTPEAFKPEIENIMKTSLKNIQPFVGKDRRFNHKEFKDYEEYLKLIISNKLSPYFENELNNAIHQTSQNNFESLMIFFKKDIPFSLENIKIYPQNIEKLKLFYKEIFSGIRNLKYRELPSNGIINLSKIILSYQKNGSKEKADTTAFILKYLPVNDLDYIESVVIDFMKNDTMNTKEREGLLSWSLSQFGHPQTMLLLTKAKEQAGRANINSQFIQKDIDNITKHKDLLEIVMLLSKIYYPLDTKPQFFEILNDQRLYKLPEVHKITKEIFLTTGQPPITPEKLADISAMITRNLFELNITINPFNVKRELDSIFQKRKEIKNINIFKGSDFYYIANSEPAKENYPQSQLKNRFGNTYNPSIVEKEGGIPHFFRDEEQTPDSKIKMKEELLNILRNPSQNPIRFLFDGHGTPDKLQLVKNFGISSEEFANALIERYKKQPQRFPIIAGSTEFSNIGTGGEDPSGEPMSIEAFKLYKNPTLSAFLDIGVENEGENPFLYTPRNIDPKQIDIFIFDACYSHNFTIDVYNRLQKALGSFARPIQQVALTEKETSKIS